MILDEAQRLGQAQGAHHRMPDFRKLWVTERLEYVGSGFWAFFPSETHGTFIGGHLIDEHAGGVRTGPRTDAAGNALPTATVFDAARPSPDPLAPSCAIEFECYEGMLVTIAGGSVCSGNQRFGTDPIAEVFISAGGRCLRLLTA